MPTQKFTKQDIDQLSAWFQRRNEAQFAWKSACSAHQVLPGLRGFWPMSAFGANGEAFDQSGNVPVRTLTNNNVAQYSYDGLAPYIQLTNASSQFLSRVDEAGLDIIGNETYIAAAKRGLALGGWFWFDSIVAGAGLIGKWTSAGNQRAYMLSLSGNNVVLFLSSTGAATITFNTLFTPNAGEWYHIWATWDPSTAVNIFINGTKYPFVAGIPATLFNSNSSFWIGQINGVYHDGRASLCGLCTMYHQDINILAPFEQTRSLYGVA